MGTSLEEAVEEARFNGASLLVLLEDRLGDEELFLSFEDRRLVGDLVEDSLVLPLDVDFFIEAFLLLASMAILVSSVSPLVSFALEAVRCSRNLPGSLMEVLR